MLGRDLDIEDTILHAHGLDAVLEIGLDTVLVSGISVNDVPTLGHLLTPSGLRRARGPDR